MKCYCVYWFSKGNRKTYFNAENKNHAILKALSILALCYKYSGNFCIEVTKCEVKDSDIITAQEGKVRVKKCKVLGEVK